MKWISVNGRLPESQVRVLVLSKGYSSYTDCLVGFQEDGHWFDDGEIHGETPDVTHWMPLPTPPK